MSARQIAALLGSNPDDNNNQNQPRQQVVGASVNVRYGNQHQHQQRFLYPDTVS